MSNPEDYVLLLEASTKIIKTLTLRNLLNLALLSINICGIAIVIYLLRAENKGVLVELTGRTRFVKSVDSCIVNKYYQGREHFALTQNFATKGNASLNIVAVFDDLPPDSDLRATCRQMIEYGRELNDSTPPTKQTIPEQIKDAVIPLLP